jgi:hypothetical protein
MSGSTADASPRQYAFSHECRQATAHETTMAMKIHTMALIFPAYPDFSSMQAKKIPRDKQRIESSGAKRNHIHETTLSMNTSLSYATACFDYWKYTCFLLILPDRYS